MIKFEIEITGTNSLLMHNARLSDPLGESAMALKKVSGKRVKTEEDHMEMARIEHLGGLYYEPEIGPYMPSDNIFRSIQDGAKKFKLGTAVKQAVVMTSDDNPLQYTGPRDFNDLWENKNFVHRASVKVGMARVMRTRPIFREWSVTAQGILDESILDFENLVMSAETAGQLIGLGDWRPRFGRYDVALRKVS